MRNKQKSTQFRGNWKHTLSIIARSQFSHCHNLCWSYLLVFLVWFLLSCPSFDNTIAIQRQNADRMSFSADFIIYFCLFFFFICFLLFFFVFIWTVSYAQDIMSLPFLVNVLILLIFRTGRQQQHFGIERNWDKLLLEKERRTDRRKSFTWCFYFVQWVMNKW